MTDTDAIEAVDAQLGAARGERARLATELSKATDPAQQAKLQDALAAVGERIAALQGERFALDPQGTTVGPDDPPIEGVAHTLSGTLAEREILYEEFPQFFTPTADKHGRPNGFVRQPEFALADLAEHPGKGGATCAILGHTNTVEAGFVRKSDGWPVAVRVVTCLACGASRGEVV